MSRQGQRMTVVKFARTRRGNRSPLGQPASRWVGLDFQRLAEMRHAYLMPCRAIMDCTPVGVKGLPLECVRPAAFNCSAILA